MRIRIALLLVVTAALAAACGPSPPSPGSAEWCSELLKGTIKPTAEEIKANETKCEAVIMKKVTGAVGGDQPPAK